MKWIREAGANGHTPYNDPKTKGRKSPKQNAHGHEALSIWEDERVNGRKGKDTSVKREP